MGDGGFSAIVREKFKSLPDLSSQPCIYKAPYDLRDVNEDCYRPRIISIGPFYYGSPYLESMQDCKWRCLKFFLEHDTNSHKLDLEHYLTIVRELEGKVRDCYAESIALPSDEFNGMILVDSAFLLCYIMSYHLKLSSSTALFDTYKRRLLDWGPKLTRDLLVEENQIPFFVLERLYQEAFGAAYPHTSFLEIACTFIEQSRISVVNRPVDTAKTIERIKNGPAVDHLVDLLRNLCFPSALRGQMEVGPTNQTDVDYPSSASNLRAAGVHFAASKSKNLLDITFSDGVLKIPPFQLWDSTESYFRSIILFEQSHLPLANDSYFTDYITLLEKLIKTPQDVQILVQKGIIYNAIGNEETVARLFNCITKYKVNLGNFYYSDVCKKLNAYANTRWHQWKAILRRNYFSHPWAYISMIYALVLFVLTLLQTIGTFTQ